MRWKAIALGAIAVVVGLPLLVLLLASTWIAILDRSSGSIESSGTSREYLLYVPPGYDAARPTPLVVSMHAGATWPAHQMNLTHWNRLADEHGFIVVYPAADGFPRVWHTFDAGPGLERDVRFISELIDRLQASWHIDPARIYVDGMSNGGGMAYVLACMLPHRIAAAGLVAAAHSLPAGWCPNAAPVPVIAFHGTADTLVPYDGGLFGDPLNPVKPMFPAVREWVGNWAQRNGCMTDPLASNVARDVMRLQYRQCAHGADVVLYTLQGGGHSWPGGKPPPEWRVGPTNTSVDATALMWAFFEAHPRAQRSP